MESEIFKTKVKIYLSSLVLAVIFLSGLFFGISNGKKLAQAEVVVRTAKQLQDGFKNFYLDQDRYPTVDEFNNSSVMLNYFSVFPPVQFSNGQCTQSYIYKNAEPQSYQLNICLPKSVSDFSEGWNDYQ